MPGLADGFSGSRRLARGIGCDRIEASKNGQKSPRKAAEPPRGGPVKLRPSACPEHFRGLCAFIGVLAKDFQERIADGGGNGADFQGEGVVAIIDYEAAFIAFLGKQTAKEFGADGHGDIGGGGEAAHDEGWILIDVAMGAGKLLVIPNPGGAIAAFMDFLPSHG